MHNFARQFSWLNFSLIRQFWFFTFPKGGPFGKMKNQSYLIKLKLSQLNYLAKLCIYIKFGHSSLINGGFAPKSFYQPYCPIPLWKQDQREILPSLSQGSLNQLNQSNIVILNLPKLYHHINFHNSFFKLFLSSYFLKDKIFVTFMSNQIQCRSKFLHQYHSFS